MHILGLNLGPECPALAELCRRLRASREERKYRIAAFLRGKGLDVPLEEVEALGGGVVARPHFARVMLRRGYVSSLREAFDRYLDTDEYQRIERWKVSAPECIAAIHDAGGKAVLAHPCQLGCSHGRLEEILRALKDAGLDGIECFYPRHSPNRPPPICVLQTNTASISRGQRFSWGGRPTRFLPYPHSLNLDWLGTFQNAQLVLN
ncbi:PHP domain-containing protein [Flavonifractor plautii]|nr:PHP domain-containing protein [Flavonifractor plautii]